MADNVPQAVWMRLGVHQCFRGVVPATYPIFHIIGHLGGDLDGQVLIRTDSEQMAQDA